MARVKEKNRAAPLPTERAKLLSQKVRTLSYNSLIQPVLDYWVVDKQAT